MKIEINLGTEYRIVSDGRRYKIQEKTAGFGWLHKSIYAESVFPPIPEIRTTPFLWLARLRVNQLRKAEAARITREYAVWEVTK